MAAKRTFTTTRGIQVAVYEKSVLVDGQVLFLGVEPSNRMLEDLETVLNNTHERGWAAAKDDVKSMFKGFLTSIGM